VLYQNLAPVIGPIAQQLSASQLQSLEADCGGDQNKRSLRYGENNAIRVASGSRLFGFD